MASQQALTRLRKEYLRLQKEPVALIEAAPLENNILEWHYVIKGSPDSPFEGGYYHGKIKFPAEYPFKPPSIQMTTPSGRFKPDSRLCLTMSDFHPESWNPLWSVSSILTGLQSFMNENTPTVGSVETSDESKRAYARTSLAFNMQNSTFCKLFPHYIEVYQEQTKESSPAKSVVTEKSPEPVVPESVTAAETPVLETPPRPAVKPRDDKMDTIITAILFILIAAGVAYVIR